MKRHHGPYILLALALAALLTGCWGSDKSTSLELGIVSEPAKVGSAQCTGTCHAVTADSLGQTISTTWANALHTVRSLAQCEDCHGGGGEHWGVGPIPYPSPSTAGCANSSCHGAGSDPITAFASTAHGNPNGSPEKFFLQGDAGTAQATSSGTPVYRPDGVTPVTRAQQIEECSRCHNSTYAFTYATSGELTSPSPANMPSPEVGCGSCHNGHDPADNVTIPQRTASVLFPKFRNYLVDNVLGAQTDNVAAPRVNLTSFNLVYQPNGAVETSGTIDYTNVVGTNNEIHPDRLCAACHARGVYKYAGTATHNGDAWTEWSESGHGDRNAAAFAEFSANPGAYTMDNGSAYPSPESHRSTYPWDMGLGSASAVSANTTRNGSYVSGTSTVNNTACYKCHHGIASIAYQDNVEGTSPAPVLFGDATVTCITCHSPHADATGNTKNTRKPLVMSKYSSTQVTFQGNVFFDNTDVPSAAGNETICIFCHQGRESGFTLFKRRMASGTSIGTTFLNPHYLGTGAMLWARNGYEYTDNTSGTAVPKQYGYITAHQQTNCNGCHMAASSTSGVGGHTWKILSADESVVNNTSCNVSSCHNGRVPATNSAGQFHDFRDSVFDPTADYDLDGTVEGIAKEIAGVEDHLIALLDNNGITYNDQSYPYFFIKGTTSSYSAWTPARLKAAFNIQYVIKGLPAGASSQIGRPNTTAATHNYKYILQLLMDSYENLYNNTTSPSGSLPTASALLANRPSGVRAATNYNPQSGGGYDPLQ
jgi:hypothetical protein